MSIAPTTTITRYDALLSTIFSSCSSRDRPKATIQASKLMQMRRNVSGRTRWMMNAPSGTPTTMLGTIRGMSDRL